MRNHFQFQLISYLQFCEKKTRNAVAMSSTSQPHSNFFVVELVTSYLPISLDVLHAVMLLSMLCKEKKHYR